MAFKDSSVDCPLAMLGYLKPSEQVEELNLETYHDGKVVNGVPLSRQVIEELERLGVSLSWYSASQLKDAVIATHYDGRLIDDPKGVNFHDQLTLTKREQEADELDRPFARMRVKTARHGSHQHGHLPKKKQDKKKDQTRNGIYGLK